MNERKIAIVGSREGVDRASVEQFVDHLEPATTVVISGGARGVDTWAAERAKERDIRVRIYPAQWKKHGKRAGFIRNELIVDAADDIVAFWNGQSKGTEHTIGLAIEKRKPVAVFNSLGTLIRFIDEEGTVFAPNWGTDERTKHPEGRQGS